MMAGAGAIGQTFSPASISGLQLWLDANDRGSTTNQWDDKSGNNNHYTAASAAQFPTFSGGIASFDGVQQYVSGPNHLSSLSAGSVFMRVKKDTAGGSGTNTGIAAFGTNGNNDHYIYGTSIYIGWGITNRPNWGVGGDELIWHNLSTEISSGGIYKGHTHNVQRYSAGGNTPSWRTTPSVGKSSGSYYFEGHIKAVVIYNKVLSTQERADLETYLDGL
jgi:hypothetical protein